METKESYNPRIKKDKKEYLALLEDFRKTNPLLADLLHSVAFNRSIAKRIFMRQGTYIIRLMRATGADRILLMPRDVDDHAELFWALVEQCWKEPFTKAERDYAIEGLLKLYRRMDLMRWLSPRFPAHPKSPYRWLHLSKLQKTLCERRVSMDDVFVVNYSIARHPRLVVIPCRNKALRELVVDAFNNYSNKYDRREKSTAILHEYEDWFGDTINGFVGWRDLNADMLTAAKNSILERYTEFADRALRLRFVFFLFTRQLMAHPRHDFFKGSRIWTKEIVTDRKVAYHLAKGYDLAFHGQTSPINQREGILLIVQRADTMSSANNCSLIYTIDLSELTYEPYWEAAADFCLHHKFSRTHAMKTFLVWLQDYKQSRGEDPLVITAKNLTDYRATISRRTENGAGRNSHINNVTKFLRRASDCHFLSLTPGALERFGYFESQYAPAPQPVRETDIPALRQALKELSESEPRYALSLIITDLLLTNEIRVGQLCKFRLSHLSQRPDGGYDYESRVKNRGVGAVRQVIPPAAAARLREAMSLTEKVRSECPSEALADMLFLYRNGPYASIPFGVMNATRFGQDLAKASERAGLPKVNPGMLRDAYMTRVVVHVSQNGLTDLQQQALSAHFSKISINSYASLDIGTVIDAMPVVNIGD